MNMKGGQRFGLALVSAGAIALTLGGCKVTQVADVPPPQAFKPPKQQIPVPVAVAGLPQPQADPSIIRTVDVASYKVTPRPDPFALRSFEEQYETKENNERVFATTGSFFGPVFIPKPESVQIEKIEPQPFRRLAGVLVGDSVMAIIDMGDGNPMQVIRPGMQIPNSPWRVVSIDAEKAVLRRSGFVKPNEVVVRLQSPQFNGAAPAQQPQNQQPQQPGQTPGQQQPPSRRGRFGGGGGGGGGRGFGGGAGGVG